MSLRNLLSAWLLLPLAAAGQEPTTFPQAKVTLRSGQQFSGLVLSETPPEVEFAEIVRPAGKPMYAIVRGIPRGSIFELARLTPDEHTLALAQFNKFRQRSAIEAARIEQVKLDRLRNGDRVQAFYTGPWFTLVSTADDDSTRRIIVRLEQLFRAFRQILPPRIAVSQPPTVRLFGSRDEYRDQLREWGLNIENPAFYSSTERTMVASSNLQPLVEQMATRNREEQALQDELRQREVAFNQSLTRLTDDLRNNGFSADDIVTEVRARRSQWENEQKALQQRLTDIHRRNEQRFQEANAAFFARLAHEAFHAYVEHQVFPPEQGRLPRWLNEGLAQMFETGQFDGELMRIDAPSKERLAALKGDLTGLNSFNLTKFLQTNDDKFLQVHDRRNSERLYRYSWGLAWYLTFIEPRLNTAAIDRYLAVQERETTAVERFETLVGRPLPEFEKRWQEALLGLK